MQLLRCSADLSWQFGSQGSRVQRAETYPTIHFKTPSHGTHAAWPPHYPCEACVAAPACLPLPAACYHQVGCTRDAFPSWATKVLALGYSVGRVEEVRGPARAAAAKGGSSNNGGSGLLQRRLVRIYTPGTAVDAYLPQVPCSAVRWGAAGQDLKRCLLYGRGCSLRFRRHVDLRRPRLAHVDRVVAYSRMRCSSCNNEVFHWLPSFPCRPCQLLQLRYHPHNTVPQLMRCPRLPACRPMAPAPTPRTARARSCRWWRRPGACWAAAWWTARWAAWRWAHCWRTRGRARGRARGAPRSAPCCSGGMARGCGAEKVVHSVCSAPCACAAACSRAFLGLR